MMLYGRSGLLLALADVMERCCTIRSWRDREGLSEGRVRDGNVRVYAHKHTYTQMYVCIYIFLKPSLYRPGQALRAPVGRGSQISKQLAHKCDKFVRRLYSPGNIPGTHFCQRLSQPQGHSAAGRIMSKKVPMTPSGIEPATFRLVAQCLNQLCHCVPPPLSLSLSLTHTLSNFFFLSYRAFWYL